MFDTADIYGSGQSEQWLGEALAGVRDDVVIATKFGWPDTRGTGITSSDATTSVEHSLQRLATDRIDLLYVHQPDLDEPIDATLEKLDALVRAGKVREVGCSNVTAEHMRAADDAAHARGLRPFACVEEQYNLLWRKPEQDLLPTCAELGMHFVPFFPLANGLLTGKYKLDELPGPETRLGWVLQRGVTGEDVATNADDATRRARHRDELAPAREGRRRPRRRRRAAVPGGDVGPHDARARPGLAARTTRRSPA